MHTHRVITLTDNRLDLLTLALFFVLFLGSFGRSLYKIVVIGSGPVRPLGFRCRNRYFFLLPLVIHDFYTLLENDF